MTPPDDIARLHHIVEAAEEVEAFLSGRPREDLNTNVMLVRAVVKSIEIVGGASARLSPAMRAAIPEVPWADIISMRDRLVYGYFDTDLNVVWSTAQDDLPPLREQVEAALARLGHGGS